MNSRPLTIEECENLFTSWRAVQKPGEFIPLLRRAGELPAKNVMEIGVYLGGTLRSWQAVLPEDGCIIALDSNLSMLDTSIRVCRERLPETNFIELDSTLPLAVERTKCLLDGRMLDVLWIDGDHTYNGVKSDYDLFNPFVRPGGLIAFHDIIVHTNQPWVGVPVFWKEVNDSGLGQELLCEPLGWGGIGILTKT